jgi:hypothetical protein
MNRSDVVSDTLTKTLSSIRVARVGCSKHNALWPQRDLHAVRLGEDKTWQALIGDIRQQNSSLRALKEELNRAGL